MVGRNGADVVAGRAHVGSGMFFAYNRDLERWALRMNAPGTEKVAILKRKKHRHEANVDFEYLPRGPHFQNYQICGRNGRGK